MEDLNTDLLKKTELFRDKVAKRLRNDILFKYRFQRMYKIFTEPVYHIELQDPEHVRRHKYQMMEAFKRTCDKNIKKKKKNIYMEHGTKEICFALLKDCKTEWMTEMSIRDRSKIWQLWYNHHNTRGINIVYDENPEIEKERNEKNRIKELFNEKEGDFEMKREKDANTIKQLNGELEQIKVDMQKKNDDQKMNYKKEIEEIISQRENIINSTVSSRIAVDQNELRNEKKRNEELELRLKKSEDSAKERYDDMIQNLSRHIKSIEDTQKEERETYRNEKREMKTDLNNSVIKIEDLKTQLIQKTYRTNQAKGDEGEKELQNMLVDCVGEYYDIKDVHGSPHEMDLRICHSATNTKIIFDAKNYKDKVSISRQNDFLKDGKAQHKLDSKISAAVLVSMNTKMVSEKRGTPRLGMEWLYQDGMFFVWLSEIRKYPGRLEGAISLLETLFDLPNYDNLLKNKRLKSIIDKTLNRINARRASNVNRMEKRRTELNKQIKDEKKYAGEIRTLVGSLLITTSLDNNDRIET